MGKCSELQKSEKGAFPVVHVTDLGYELEGISK